MGGETNMKMDIKEIWWTGLKSSEWRPKARFCEVGDGFE